MYACIATATWCGAEDGALESWGDRSQVRSGSEHRLGEIEAGLRRCDGVLEAVVLAPGQERLVAYLESAVDETAYPALIATCREHLRTHLPDYMVPAHFMVLARLPLNPSGKIDRKALPAPTPASGNGEPGAMRARAPRSVAEICRAAGWSAWAPTPVIDVAAIPVADAPGGEISAVRARVPVMQPTRQETCVHRASGSTAACRRRCRVAALAPTSKAPGDSRVAGPMPPATG